MKTICMLVRRSLRQHFLSTAVTSLSIALAGGLWLSVWAIRDQANAVFTEVHSGFDAVLGARGSKLQLVLNAIFHVEASPGNLAWEDFEDIQSNPAVAAAIPLAVGDNYRGYRLREFPPICSRKLNIGRGSVFKCSPTDAFLIPENKRR